MTPLDIARQFYAVEYQLAVLKGMFQQLAGAAPTAYPPAPPPPAYKSDPPKPDSPTGSETLNDGAMVLELRDFHIQIGAMQLHWGPADDTEPADPAETAANFAPTQPATEAPEPRVPQKGDLLNLHGEPVHFDGKHWVKGPTPANGTLNVPDARPTVTDRTVGLSGEG